MGRAVQLLVFLLPLVLGDQNSNAVIKASNQFANKLYQRLAQESSDNLLVCPFSLHVVLTMVHQGAVEKSAAELATVLGLSDANLNIGEGYKSLLTGLQDSTLNTANKLFPAKSFQINPDYVRLAQEYFISEVENVDYNKTEEAASTINKYVEEKTNNKIHDLVQPDLFSHLTRLVIVNAVHFQAKWNNKFDYSYDGQFKVTPDKPVTTRMMSQTNWFDYKEDSQLDSRVLKMGYKDGDYSMVVILPNKEDGLAALEAKLVDISIEDILKGLKSTEVAVTIPKFKIEKEMKLVDTLQKMGIAEVFDEEKARLDKMGKGDLYVSEVLQKTFLDVYEEGTEAAAATAVLIVEAASAKYPPPEIFYANHPFFFGLIKGNTALFFGRFVGPK